MGGMGGGGTGFHQRSFGSGSGHPVDFGGLTICAAIGRQEQALDRAFEDAPQPLVESHPPVLDSRSKVRHWWNVAGATMGVEL